MGSLGWFHGICHIFQAIRLTIFTVFALYILFFLYIFIQYKTFVSIYEVYKKIIDDLDLFINLGDLISNGVDTIAN